MLNTEGTKAQRKGVNSPNLMIQTMFDREEKLTTEESEDITEEPEDIEEKYLFSLCVFVSSAFSVFDSF